MVRTVASSRYLNVAIIETSTIKYNWCQLATAWFAILAERICIRMYLWMFSFWSVNPWHIWESKISWCSSFFWLLLSVGVVTGNTQGWRGFPEACWLAHEFCVQHTSPPTLASGHFCLATCGLFPWVTPIQFKETRRGFSLFFVDDFGFI